jgi:hypothetical protein
MFAFMLMQEQEAASWQDKAEELGKLLGLNLHTRAGQGRFRALTGLPWQAFCCLLATFQASYAAMRQEQAAAKLRQRQVGGGRKSKLPTITHKLYFILYYLKNYPTLEALGDHFQMATSQACRQVQQLLPVLLRALEQVAALPKREFASVEEIAAAFADQEELFIDATERARRRPQDEAEQKAHYSGKKKQHTVKNIIFSDARRRILFLGYTVAGSQHDYALLKQSFPTTENWFAAFKLWVDLGFLGIAKDYPALELHIPHKKPRKSKANPTPTLTEQQKAENRRLSRVRVVVENAIARMKRWSVLTAKFRNHADHLIDDVALACAGLANWLLPC